MQRPIEWIKQLRLDRAMLRSLWREHLLALLLYALLSVAISWPTVQHFTTSITGPGDSGTGPVHEHDIE